MQAAGGRGGAQRGEHVGAGAERLHAAHAAGKGHEVVVGGGLGREGRVRFDRDVVRAGDAQVAGEGGGRHDDPAAAEDVDDGHGFDFFAAVGEDHECGHGAMFMKLRATGSRNDPRRIERVPLE